jgi:hypothetical protein
MINYSINTDYSYLKNLILNIDKEFELIDKSIHNERNILKIFEFNSKKFVVKSFKIPHLLNQIVYNFFRKSKAERSFINASKLLELDINTPMPIAYIEFINFGLFKKSFFISEYSDFDFDIRAVLFQENFNDKDNIIKQFIEFAFDMHNKNIFHIDFSPGNILIKKIEKDKHQYHFSVIDLNRMKFIELDLDLRMKSLSRLTQNRDDNISFAKHYASISKYDVDECMKKLFYYIQENDNYLKNKKRLKKLKF